MAGTLNFTYPSGRWLHPHSALGVRPVPGVAGACDLVFHIGSADNVAVTPLSQTVTLSSAEIAGASGAMLPDSIYKVTITDHGSSITASALEEPSTTIRTKSPSSLIR